MGRTAGLTLSPGPRKSRTRSWIEAGTGPHPESPIPSDPVVLPVFVLTEAQEGGRIGRHGQHLAVCFVLVLGMEGQGPAVRKSVGCVGRGHVTRLISVVSQEGAQAAP